MKKFFIISSAIMIIIGFSAFTKTANPPYKNLKILPQNISKEQLDSVMKHFSLSLGVRCNYCHAKTEDGEHLDFPSDKVGEKNIARKMMLMTNNINANSFNMQGIFQTKSMITCYTCHRGQEQPETDIPDSLLHKMK